MDYRNLFFSIKENLHSWNKPHFSLVYVYLSLLNFIYQCFVRIFYIHFTEGNWYVVFHSLLSFFWGGGGRNTVFAWFWYQSITNFIKCYFCGTPTSLQRDKLKKSQDINVAEIKITRPLSPLPHPTATVVQLLQISWAPLEQPGLLHSCPI